MKIKLLLVLLLVVFSETEMWWTVQMIVDCHCTLFLFIVFSCS
jgi:hypothetical protein